MKSKKVLFKKGWIVSKRCKPSISVEKRSLLGRNRFKIRKRFVKVTVCVILRAEKDKLQLPQ